MYLPVKGPPSPDTYTEFINIWSIKVVNKYPARDDPRITRRTHPEYFIPFQLREDPKNANCSNFSSRRCQEEARKPIRIHELELEPAIQRSKAPIFAKNERVRRETAANRTLKGACLVWAGGSDDLRGGGESLPGFEDLNNFPMFNFDSQNGSENCANVLS